MEAQPPVVEGQRHFKTIRPPFGKKEGPTALRVPPEDTVDSQARTSRNLVIWTFCAFVAFWVMIFAAYMFAR